MLLRKSKTAGPRGGAARISNGGGLGCTVVWRWWREDACEKREGGEWRGGRASVFVFLQPQLPLFGTIYNTTQHSHGEVKACVQCGGVSCERRLQLNNIAMGRPALEVIVHHTTGLQ
jgi:hypothetical protein